MDNRFSRKGCCSVLYSYLFYVKKLQPRSVLQSGISVMEFLFKKRVMGPCVAYAFKYTSQSFIPVGPDQDLISLSATSEWNSIVGSRRHVKMVSPWSLAPRLLKKSQNRWLREKPWSDRETRFEVSLHCPDRQFREVY